MGTRMDEALSETTRMRQEHDELLSRLSTRRSTEHLARGAASALMAVVVALLAGKVWWDVGDVHPEWAVLCGVLSAAAFIYAGLCLGLGRRCLREELSELERLNRMRRSLCLDDPSLMLPK